MLAVADLEVAYGQSVVLRGLSLTLTEGEVVALLGRNGMGKTTLMRALMGILPLRSGSITFAGRELAPLQSFERVRAGLAYVPQGRGIFASLTVEENIATGLAARGARTVPEDLYALFPALESMRRRRGGNLSGGQQQQLAIARALATQPKALLLDEPTEGIQPSIVRDLARTLRQIRDQRGLAILLTEQVLAFALELADRILVIENGRLVHEAPRGAFDEASLTRFLAV